VTDGFEMPTDDNPVVVHQGDCLDLLRRLPDGCVDAVVTDPPYAVVNDAASAVSRSQRSVKETQFFESWLREHLIELARVTRTTGALWMTIDWRGAVVLDAACAKLGLREPKVGVWDKECIGMGYVLRNSYECFAVVPLADFQRQTASEPDVWRHRWGQGDRESDHAAEKPLELLRRACRLVSHPGGLVLDPFAGSGTTGAAAVIEGRRAILIEKEPIYVDVTRRRIAKASGAGSLFATTCTP